MTVTVHAAVGAAFVALNVALWYLIAKSLRGK